MNARLIRTLSLAIVVFVFCPLLAAQAAKTKTKSKTKEAPPPATTVETASDTLPPVELTVGFQARDAETEGIGDLLVPLWNPGGTGLLFVNPRSALTDHDGEEYNLGVGYRQLLPKQKVIVGANAYYDYRDTGYSNHDQWGVGFEILSSWIDARANYYEPDDKQYVVASQTETETAQTKTTTEGWTDPYATDHYIVQDYVITHTLTTLTTTKTFEQYEQALGGYDWEIGLRLPLPVKQETLEARVFGGAYDFDRDFGDDAQGWKARAELRVLASLFLDAGAYENEDLTGSDWFAGARLSVPLDLAKISQGRNPFSTAKSRLNSEPRDFGARLTEMVMRDPQIRLETSKFLENKALQTEETTSTRSKETQPTLLLPDVNFVDGDVHRTGDGTAEHPFPTIQQGVNAVFGSRNVYVYNASGAYEENVVLTEGVSLLGSGILIPGVDGRFFGSGIQPIVDGMGRGPAITMADHTTVRGFSIRNTDTGRGSLTVDLPVLGPTDVSRVGILGNDANHLTITENTIAGNSIGVLLAREGDFDLTFANNQVMYNEGDGLRIVAQGTSVDSTFDVLVQNSQFNDNGASGATLMAFNYGFAVAEIQGGTLNDNQGQGAIFDMIGNQVAMALVSGVQAEDNDGIGVLVDQVNNMVSLANLSDISANDNGATGVMLVQDSDVASVGVIGMPQGVGTTVNDLAARFGLALPDEVAQFLAPGGPVTANNNGGGGVLADLHAQDGIALGALFDITANNNLGNGIQANIVNDHGVALGLGGSSENWEDILDLGSQVADLFDLDLPLSISGNGHMQANGNTAMGFMMNTAGRIAAINAIVGLETSGNGAFGTLLNTSSEQVGVSALARLNAFGNGAGGLSMDTFGSNAAISVIADVNASDNFGNGITANVTSPDGIAALLTLSTDLLRPVASWLGAEYLGAPFEVPGASFGPVLTSGNIGNGILANVNGANLAAALFLDTWADGNSQNGFDLTVDSTNGTAITAMIASDVVLRLLNTMSVLPDPIDFTPLGYVSASTNNGNGILLNQTGLHGAYSLLTGIRADDNTGDGINASLTSSTGDVYAILVDADADSNGMMGTRLNLNAYGYAISALLFTDADDNGIQGFHITQTSTGADSLALLGGVDAWDNTGAGMVYNLTAAGNAVACISDAQSEYNGGRGASFTLNAGGTAALFAGTNALEKFNGNFAGGLGGGILDTFSNEIPQGSSEFNYNGAAGLYADITSTGSNVWLNIEDADAVFNTNGGFNLTLSALHEVAGNFHQIDANNNGGTGINAVLAGGSGVPDTLDFWLSDVRTIGNDGNGINVVATNYNGNVEIGGERIVSVNNTNNGVRVNATSTLPAVLTLDFGGGAFGSVGHSSIYGNGAKDFRNSGAGTVMAEQNWWGVAPPLNSQFGGSIDRNPWLLSDPN